MTKIEIRIPKSASGLLQEALGKTLRERLGIAEENVLIQEDETTYSYIFTLPDSNLEGGIVVLIAAIRKFGSEEEIPKVILMVTPMLEERATAPALPPVETNP